MVLSDRPTKTMSSNATTKNPQQDDADGQALGHPKALQPENRRGAQGGEENG
jgi:hypothetical protein